MGKKTDIEILNIINSYKFINPKIEYLVYNVSNRIYYCCTKTDMPYIIKNNEVYRVIENKKIHVGSILKKDNIYNV